MRARARVLAPVTVATALCFVACTAKPENSPVIRKKFAEMDTMNQKVSEMRTTLDSVSADLRILNEQIAEVRALNPDTANGTDIIKRIEALERRSASSQPTLATNPSAAPVHKPGADAANGATALASAEPSTLNAKLAVPAEPAVKKVSNDIVSTAPAAAKAGVAKETKEAKKAPEPAKAKAEPARKAAPRSAGRYYRVQPGDTLESIAPKNGIPADAIRSSNKLPSGSSVPAGQNLYLPGKG